MQSSTPESSCPEEKNPANRAPAAAPLVAWRPDSPATLLAAGSLAYVTQTMAHELGGHGVACWLAGGQVTVLAPLWMRCTQTPWWLTAAGPAANIVLAVIFALLVRLVAVRAALTGLLLWLGFSFNALVACGYLGVGALTGFGDWPVLFGGVTPGWMWRVPALGVAGLGYFICLRVAAALFSRLAGAGQPAAAALRRRALIPAAGAALTACGAELYGGRAAVLPLGLALGCTLVIGFSLTSMDDAVAVQSPAAHDLGPVTRAPWLIGLASAVAIAFVALIGPGLSVQH